MSENAKSSGLMNEYQEAEINAFIPFCASRKGWI